MITRRQFILRAVGGTLAAGACGVAYASYIEPRWLALSRIRIPFAARDPVPSPLRILHLSDLHLSREVSLEFIVESIELGVAEKPDLIAVTGDFFTGGTRDVSSYAKALRRLSETAPTFACLGNHDGGQWSQYHGGLKMVESVLGLLGDADIICLVNDSRVLSVAGRLIQVVGIGDYWSGLCQPAAAFANIAPKGDALRILLNHNPDAKDLVRRYEWDLMLSGHTHGGQVRLPVIGAPFAPVRDKRYLHGLYAWDQRWLHISSGVGNLHGVRFNCRPEISLLTVG